MIRVATFNTQHGAKEGGRIGHPRQFAKACASLDVDILALQEVDRRVIRSGFVDMAALAAKACGMSKPLFFPTRRVLGGEYGNALLFRGELLADPAVIQFGKQYGAKLPSTRNTNRPNYDTRNTFFTRIRLGDLELSVGTGHLSVGRVLASGQLTRSVAALNRMEGPRLLLLDANLGLDRIEELDLPGELEFAHTPLTCPASSPTLNPDHIAVQGLSIISVTDQIMPVSDHRAIVAELDVPDHQ